MDRGFLFGDGIYEVVSVYQGKIFSLNEHLQRLQKSLDSVKIANPHTQKQWLEICNKLLSYAPKGDYSIYFQITRGVGAERKHDFETLTPTVYLQLSKLVLKGKKLLSQGFSAITQEDIRWHRCDIKSTSLLANTLYAQNAKENQVEEVILQRNNIITEGATSNVFILKNNILQTHPTDNNILAGITRDLTLKSADACSLEINESTFNRDDLMSADEVWISSSTREIMPINKIDSQAINNGKIGKYWNCVYDHYQQLKND
ncbi:MAG: branched-chain amino acid--2-keto-4-methylthiobutyrate aminotransferase [Candidatus Thioglobus sp.]|nr:MAG: branched-chain amino acid--2-keto-4-methylthiobutyrate aminotransferase [Candidatus Thioglobus sp.]KAA0449324.1 MAG: branched-chain amino acid--2-keto-4-methylthiobutyrate aminotransferase [Candidatus Thioglobus sp.]